MTSDFLTLDGNEVLSVTTESVNMDLEIGQNIPCYVFAMSDCVALPQNGL